MTNVPPSVLQKLNRNLHNDQGHPLGILKGLIEKYLPDFEPVCYPSAVVTPSQNFDQLGFPHDHPGRKKEDSYYLNSAFMLRTHSSAHEVDTFATGKERWLISADVYRRDEVDSCHYPVFHQMEGARVVNRAKIEELLVSTIASQSQLSRQNVKIDDRTHVSQENPIQSVHHPAQAHMVVENLKATVNLLIFKLFSHLSHTRDEPLQIHWIPAFFPFTSPSYEVEVMFMGKRLEILGCGVVQQKTLDQANVPEKIGWAFGLGLERIAMVLFSIPDIRLFWSSDPRFRSQFRDGKVTQFHPFSKNPACYKDLSFWLPDGFEVNDFYEIIRDSGGSWIEEVKLLDDFTHPKTKRVSRCYRIAYRSMERNLSNEEVNAKQADVCEALQKRLGLRFR